MIFRIKFLKQDFCLKYKFWEKFQNKFSEIKFMEQYFQNIYNII